MKFVRESLLAEFKRGLDPKEAMGTGVITKMKADLEKFGLSPDQYTILPDLTIKTERTSWRTDLYIKLVTLKYAQPAKYEFVIKIMSEEKKSTHVIDYKAAIDKALKDGLSKKDIEELLIIWADSDIKSKGNVYVSKQTRKLTEKEYDEEHNIYAFIGFTEKVPVKGTKYFEDKLGTETIIKVDKFNMADLQSISMMKQRARIQYPDGQVYIVYIPPELMDEDRYESIPQHCYDIFVKYKKRV